jgi:hypothetical protein
MNAPTPVTATDSTRLPSAPQSPSLLDRLRLALDALATAPKR